MYRQMSPQEIVATFDKQNIIVYYQPQFNHCTHQMIGAEALMRMDHPEFGMQSPAFFITALEEAGLIFDADLQVFTNICAFQRQCLDNRLPVLPVSFNVSRYDLYQHDFLVELERIRKSFNIPVNLLRAEITETAAIGGTTLLAKGIEKLHSFGYYVEMDDFGSGYSSLNALKDLPVDAIKLDMHFMSNDINGRGGTIIKSIVQMAKWMNTPMIAEGVETLEQADFLSSIGCSYIQNITSEKKHYDELSASERRFRHASEQANVYAWEYDIARKEMRPCFRCMRDLGLPPLVTNYPEPAIDAGIFPQDYADMYRDWHRQLAEGVGTLEAIIPLTVGRVPFHVRYTTEFDENGKPVKAYGSATLVVDQQ